MTLFYLLSIHVLGSTVSGIFVCYRYDSNPPTSSDSDEDYSASGSGGDGSGSEAERKKEEKRQRKEKRQKEKTERKSKSAKTVVRAIWQNDDPILRVRKLCLSDFTKIELSYIN